jgi:hypothetical protein
VAHWRQSIPKPEPSSAAEMICTLIEGQHRSPQGWQDVLHCEASELLTLVSRNVLRVSGDGLTLRFVGVCCLERSVCICLPALGLPAANGSVGRAIRQLSRLLQVYLKRSGMRRGVSDGLADAFVEDSRATEMVRDVDLLASLLRVTEVYGFHCLEQSRYDHEDGVVVWPETIKRSLLHRTRTGVVYLSPVSRSARSHLSPLGILQAQVLLKLYQTYRGIAEACVGNAAEMAAAAERVLETVSFHGSPSGWVLGEWAASLNRDHETELVSLLTIAASRDRRSMRVANAIALYGTTAVELVWEDMCRYVVGDTVTDDTRKQMSNPVLMGPEGVVLIDKQRPDFIFVDSACTFLCDAKYYPMMPHSLPGLDDVRKQMVYGMSSEGSVRLVFMVPGTLQDVIRAYGTYRMMRQQKVDEVFPDVHCLLCDWDSVAAEYLSQQRRYDWRAAIVRCVASEPVTQ